jgi:hypothetical protein
MVPGACMLRPVPLRIVLFKLTESWSSQDGRTRLAGALVRNVPRRHGLVSLEAGLPADAAALKSWDLAAQDVDVRAFRNGGDLSEPQR